MRYVGFLSFLLCASAYAAPAYDRDDWKHWIDADSDCQNTRQEFLIRRSIVPVTFTVRQDGRDCTVRTGAWFDPATGQFFVHGSDVDIDHTIPLKWAHDH